MSRLNTLGASATGRTAELFAGLKAKLGKVPNAYDAIGSNSPVALEAILDFDGALAASSLARKEIEVIKLAVSEAAGCDYCLAAHTLMGKMAGLSQDAMLAAAPASRMPRWSTPCLRSRASVVDFPAAPR
jgi:AhpD family alkylhydroperoxidase